MAKDAPTSPASATDHLFWVWVETAAVAVVMAGGDWCGSGISASVNTPFPESFAYSMACVNAACEVGHDWFQLS